MELAQLGVDKEIKFCETIDELRKGKPSIIIAECVTGVRYRQNNYKVEQEFKKHEKYVMSLGMYMQSHADKVVKNKILKPSNIKFNKVYKPYKGQDLNNKTLFVWRQGGIGDLLFINPNLLYLKKKYPTCKIILGCGPQYHSMVEKWEFIDEVIAMPFNISLLFKI